MRHAISEMPLCRMSIACRQSSTWQPGYIKPRPLFIISSSSPPIPPPPRFPILPYPGPLNLISSSSYSAAPPTSPRLANLSLCSLSRCRTDDSVGGVKASITSLRLIWTPRHVERKQYMIARKLPFSRALANMTTYQKNATKIAKTNKPSSIACLALVDECIDESEDGCQVDSTKGGKVEGDWHVARPDLAAVLLNFWNGWRPSRHLLIRRPRRNLYIPSPPGFWLRERGGKAVPHNMSAGHHHRAALKQVSIYPYASYASGS
jgi:hypothetical protein